MESLIEWCFEQHRKINHLYTGFLPYEFHLKMAMNVYEEWKYLLDDEIDYFTGEKYKGVRGDETVTLRSCCYYATAGHDLLEDCHLSYSDISIKLGQETAEIIFAVTNEKGKTRQEKANDKYYNGIRNTKGAVFVKLCDRIANVQYSKMTKSRMYEMYKDENPHFLEQLGYKEGRTLDCIFPYMSMVDYLLKIFND
jgi:(p)ppGpp synthase/HD superfamily hydrolase